MAALDEVHEPSKAMDWRALTLVLAAALSADDVLGAARDPL
jgi:hypothetical protein